MAFIRTQKLVRNQDGSIKSGSAAIMESRYDPDMESGHSRQVTRESLGKILWLDDDRKSGIFLSRDRGLVEYDVRTDEFKIVTTSDPRLDDNQHVPQPPLHSSFGSVYLLTSFLCSSGLIDVLRNTFAERKDYERLLAHVVHGFLKDGSRIKCSTFIEQSAISNLFDHLTLSTLACDSRFFALLGRDETKMAYFKALVSWMRRTVPDFGKACYVDSTKLPNDAKDNPYNKLRCERGKGCEVQIRMALILDKITGIPVWYELIEGTQIDMKTLRYIMDDVMASLNIEIDSLVLDAGYCSKELIHRFGVDSNSSLIVRMPKRPGYPYLTLYHRFKEQFHQPKYGFVREGNLHFGRKAEIELFKEKIYAYVYVNKDDALHGYEEFTVNHADEAAKMTNKELRWRSVSSGFFILVSNIDTTPPDLLDRYIRRVRIELLFKVSKSFEDLMPLSKWTAQTVRGKILYDMMTTVIRAWMYHEMTDLRQPLMDYFHTASSNDCVRNAQNELIIRTPTPDIREAFRVFNATLPASLSLDSWAAQLRM